MLLDTRQAVWYCNAMKHDLDTQLKARLSRVKGDWPVIAQKSGLSYSWVCKFAVGQISNPGYETLRKLSSALGEKPAKV